MAKFIGIGACGNKAVVDLIETQVVTRENAFLFNSTMRDVPVDYKEIAAKVGSGMGGCGKERIKGKSLFVDAIKRDKLDYLDEFIGTDDTVYIITSSEGGTGSGAAPVIAAYYKKVHNIEVHMVVFTGFEDDVRGLANTVEFFQDLSDDIVIHAISNKKFLYGTNGNKLNAEKLANRELGQMITVLLGQTIKDSDQNIDETDLFKVVNTPGYSLVISSVIDKSIKNHEAFNKLLSNTIDNMKSVDVEDPSAKRMAIILDIAEKNRDIIDFTFDVIKEKLGMPYEIFTHVQNESDTDFISIIVSGLDLPTTELKDIHQRYLDATQRVKTDKDDFFSKIRDMETSNADFNFTTKSRAGSIDKSSFLEGFRDTPEPVIEQSQQPTKKNFEEAVVHNEKSEPSENKKPGILIKKEAFSNNY